MNFRILAKFLGALLLLESMAMAVCGVFAWLDNASSSDDPHPIYYAALITAGVGVLLLLIGAVKTQKIPRREGIIVVGVGWILCAFFGSLPYVFSEPSLPLADGFFEAASGFTTTGSTVMNDIASWPRGVLLWRSVTQWLGGMGILVLFVAILSYLGMGSKSLFRNESSFQTAESSSARIRDTAMTLWYVYAGITLVCIVGLKMLGMTTYNAVSHAFTAVSTGGFSPHNESIAYYMNWENGWLIELWLSLFMVICSLSFLFWVVLFKKRWKRLREDEEGGFFVVLCVVVSLMIAWGIACSQGLDFWTALRYSWFTVVSIASTTGFGLVDYSQWPGFALVALAGLMLLGGCSGSTAGGVKVSRMIVFLKTARLEIVKAFRPNQVFRMHVNGNALGVNERSQTVVFVALYGLIVVVSCFVVAVLEVGNGIDMLTSFGCVVATLSNIGPGFGNVGPMDNFSHLLPVTKVFLALLMILGRLELYAILVLFMPSIWRKY